MSDMESQDEKERLVANAVAALREHFGSVQIMVSYQDSENTMVLFRGMGDWYARQGLAHLFIKQEAAVEIASALNENDNDSWRTL